MNLKIKLSDTDKINAALDEVQAKSRVRTITVENIEAMCEIVFKRCGISKKAMNGVSFTADWNAQAFPNAYKGIPESTIVSASFVRGEWIITDISRGTTRRPTVAYHVCLTDDAKAAIIQSIESFG